MEKKKITVGQFHTFLKENGVTTFYERMAYLGRASTKDNVWVVYKNLDGVLAHKPEKVIIHAFDWSDTDEGLEYWTQIHDKWHALVDKVLSENKAEPVKEDLPGEVEVHAQYGFHGPSILYPIVLFMQVAGAIDPFKAAITAAHESLEKFVERYKDYKHKHLLDSAFLWENTPEGEPFWGDLNERYQKFLELFPNLIEEPAKVKKEAEAAARKRLEFDKNLKLFKDLFTKYKYLDVIEANMSAKSISYDDLQDERPERWVGHILTDVTAGRYLAEQVWQEAMCEKRPAEA